MRSCVCPCLLTKNLALLVPSSIAPMKDPFIFSGMLIFLEYRVESHRSVMITFRILKKERDKHMFSTFALFYYATHT